MTCEECGESVADPKTRKVKGKVLCIPAIRERSLGKRKNE
jgi:formylmethanofuran dehydrogenase subunit E